MNQEAVLWIFGTIITLCTLVIGKLLASVDNLTGRVIRIETTFSLFNEKAANILHSPHTPELDLALEKLVVAYHKNHDLKMEEWRELLRLVELIENDRELLHGERLIAAMISTTCRVKLEMTPTGFRKTI